jgi:putative hydrolase of the HAD superfamily
MIRGVTLDAAGTLFAPREPVGVTYARIAAQHGIDADAGAVDAEFRRAFRSAPPLAFPDAPVAARAACERAWWRDVVRTALAVDAADPRLEPCFAALFAHYARPGAWRVFPDVAPALAALRRTCPLAVVSNFDGRLAGLLADLAIASAVDAIVWSSDVGAAKPDRAIFAAAARALGVPLASLLHVGDDPAVDVAGAEGAGARAFHLDRGAGRTLADVVRLVAVDQA